MESFCFPADTRMTEVLGYLGGSWAHTVPGLQEYFNSSCCHRVIEYSVITEETDLGSFGCYRPVTSVAGTCSPVSGSLEVQTDSLCVLHSQFPVISPSFWVLRVSPCKTPAA